MDNVVSLISLDRSERMTLVLPIRWIGIGILFVSCMNTNHMVCDQGLPLHCNQDN